MKEKRAEAGKGSTVKPSKQGNPRLKGTERRKQARSAKKSK
jgi:hypothetical protein